jgi:ABC-type sugar transport system permease subunit
MDFVIDIVAKLIPALLTAAIAVITTGAIWIGANLAVYQAHKEWSRFQALLSGGLAFVGVAIVSGNRAIDALVWKDEGTWLRLLGFLVLPTIVAAIVVGLVLGAGQLQRSQQLPVMVGVGAAIGAVLGIMFEGPAQPGLNILALLLWLAIPIAIAFGYASLRRIDPVRPVLAVAAFGWLAGWFVGGETGGGSSASAAIALAVPLALIGARSSLGEVPTGQALRRMDETARRVIFLGPAVIFIFGALVVPTISTIILSMKGRDGEKTVWFDNYQEIFTATGGSSPTFNVDKWSDFFTSNLTLVALVLLVFGVGFGLYSGNKQGYGFGRSGGSIAPIAAGVFLGATALMTVLRGTLFNNIWWVFTVTLMSTGMGLAIAVLSDGARFEKVAKAFIFMPMAISFVGATIIWRFMYISRPPGQSQTGVMNRLWVALGDLSTSESWPKVVATIVIALVLAGLVLIAVQGFKDNRSSTVGGALGSLLVFGYLSFEFLRSSLGGINGETNVDFILFVQNAPWNNVFLMVVLIWIQTGFAMVILSAAIKAVPNEFIEAASVDGATESQIFWRVTLPQIAPTIGVVTTTIMVLVMKVFDIVKVMTNGQFGTQVLANDMFTKAFSNFNQGLGAALAVLIFVLILPIMVLNVRRMQQAEV